MELGTGIPASPEGQNPPELEQYAWPSLDPAGVELETVLNLPVVRPLLEDFQKLTGMVVAILDLNGRILVAEGWQDICTKFHRVNPSTSKDCTISDLYLAGNVKRGEYIAYKCNNGLWDVVTPLYIANTHMGNIYTGQFFYDNDVIDRPDFEDRADLSGFDKDAYLAALDRVPRFTHEKIRTLMDFLVKLTDLVSQMALNNLRSTAFIREQARAAKALQASEEKYRVLVEQSQDIIFTLTPEGVFTFVSPSWEQALGHSIKDVIGKPFPPFVHPEDLPAWWTVLGKVIEGKDRVSKVEYRVRTRNGTWCWYRTTLGPLKGPDGAVVGLQGTGQNITEAKRSEAALRESRALLGLILDTIPQSVFWKDLEGRYLGCNRSFAQAAGCPDPEQLIGKTDFDLPWRESAEAYRSDDREVLARRCAKSHIIEPLQRADGTRLTIDTSKLPLFDARGNAFALLGIYEDITERLRTEEERQQIQAQLTQAQKMESLGSLAGGVAHDINNVLGAILGLASTGIEAPSTDPETRQVLETIIKATERGGVMVKGLLNFARKTTTRERQINANEILKEVVLLLERTTLAKVRIEREFAKDLRPIRGDESALEHALMNLCVNAVDAMPENGTLTLRSRNIDQDWIEVQVEDDGTGMPPKVLERAMDPFFTTKEVGKGTGLGLSMVYGIVKAHRGQMELQSKLGVGTCVKLRFPVCEPEIKPVDAITVKTAEDHHEALKIMVIDDDELIQTTMGLVLQALGHSAASARSGEEALASLEGGFQPDLVILDMNMPGLGGSGTLPRLRTLFPVLPVLLATGRADQTALEMVQADPYTTLLPKPYSIDDLRKVIAEVTKKLEK